MSRYVGQCDSNQNELKQRTREAIYNEQSDGTVVLFVQLGISSATTISKSNEGCSQRKSLPSVRDDTIELEILDEIADLHIPILRLNIDEAGEDCNERATQQIISFICQNHWRRQCLS